MSTVEQKQAELEAAWAALQSVPSYVERLANVVEYPVCKRCKRPIEQSIEGELICNLCWEQGQMSDEEREQYRLIEECRKEQWEEAKRLQAEKKCFVCEETINNSPVGHKCWYLA